MPNYVTLEGLETFDTDYREGTRDDEHSGAKSNLGRPSMTLWRLV